MPGFDLSIYNRPGLAVRQLGRGDVAGVGRALLAPETLGPTSLLPQAPSSAEGGFMATLRRMRDSNPLLRGIMSVATDPLVIASLLLSSRWPIASAKKMFQYGRKFAGYMHRPGMLEGLFARAERLFANTNMVGRWSSEPHRNLRAYTPGFFERHVEGLDKFFRQWLGNVSKTFEEFKTHAGRYPTMKEGIRISAKLEGTDALLTEKVTLTADEHRLFTRLQSRDGFFQKFFRDVVAPFQRSDAGKAYLRRVADRAGIRADSLDAVRGGKLRYFPHTLNRTPSIMLDYLEHAQQMAGKGTSGYRIAEERAVAAASAGHAAPRLGVLRPSRADLELIGTIDEKKWRVLQMESAQRARQIVNSLADRFVYQQGQKLELPAMEATEDMSRFLRSHAIAVGTREGQHMLSEAYRLAAAGDRAGFVKTVGRYAFDAAQTREYSLQLQPVLQNYVYSFARPYVWHVTKVGGGLEGIPADTTLGAAVSDELRHMNPTQRKIMLDDYIPLLQGHLTESQISGAMRWAHTKLKVVDWLDDKAAMSKHIPKGMREKLQSWLLSAKGGVSYLNVHGKVASYFYLSTLGLNPASAFQNLLQPIITTGPLVGFGNLWRAVGSTTKKLGAYFDARHGGMTDVQAMEKAFPEFIKSGLGPEPMSRAILHDALSSAYHSASNIEVPGLNVGSKGWWESAKKSMMVMFSSTERWNRLLSFEAGRIKALRDGLSAPDALHLGTQVVRATQFPAGPAQMPRILLKLPAAWRQFLYFPLRYAGFLAESTVMGGGNKRQWGTLARTVAASSIAYRAAREALGINIGQSLMFGALPLPQFQNSPFYPLPITPPLLSIGGALANAVATGDTRQLGRTASLLAPAGVQARRMWRSLHPKYARYSERTPDGKIPVYGDNQALVGHYTPMQLFMRSLGFQPTDVVAEREMSHYLLKHRDTIRDMRRQYVEAVVTGNIGEAQRLQDAFHSLYPSLGKITMKKSDIQAAQDRRFLTRVQRLLRTLPKEYRGAFGEVANAATASHMGDMFQGAEPPALMFPSAGLPAMSAGVGSAFPVGAGGAMPHFSPASAAFGP